MKFPFGRVVVSIGFGLASSMASATWLEGAVYCDANSSGQIELAHDVPLGNVYINAKCLGPSNQSGHLCPEGSDSLRATSRAYNDGEYLLNLPRKQDLTYEVNLSGNGLPSDAVILQPQTIPEQFSLPVSPGDDYYSEERQHTHVAHMDFLIQSATCIAPEPSIEICTSVELNPQSIAGFSDADMIAGDSCDDLSQNIPTGVVGDVNAQYQLRVTNNGSETLQNVVISSPEFGFVNQAIPSSCGDLEPGEVCLIDAASNSYGALSTHDTCQQPGDVMKLATVSGTGVDSGILVSDDDPASVSCTAEPHITIIKEVSLDGGAFVDANTAAAAPFGVIGSDVKYRFTLINDGNEELTDIIVTDLELGIVSLPIGVSSLSPGQQLLITESTPGFESLEVTDRCDSVGVLLNTASVSANGHYSGIGVAAEDLAYVACEQPQIELLKQVSLDGVNYFDADHANDSDVPVGLVGAAIAHYRLVVSNLGSETLTNVLVEDASLNISEVVADLVAGEVRVIESGDNGFFALKQEGVCGSAGIVPNVARVDASGVLTNFVVSDANPANLMCVNGPSVEIIKEVKFIGDSDYKDANIPSDGPIGSVGDAGVYRLIVRNSGDEPLIGVRIVDAQLGIDQVIADLSASEEVEITSQEIGFANLEVSGLCDAVGTKLNIVNVSAIGAYSGQAVNDEDPAYVSCNAPVQCDVSIDATCSVKPVAGDDKLCTDAISATTLRYTGPDLNDATVQFIGKDSGTTSYSGVDLESGVTILTKASENGYTVDAGLGNKLGSKTSIFINGQEEIIHTSCSAIYVAGAPAPLDGNTPNPAGSEKGDPSPNWEVVSFRQKDDVVIAEPTLGVTGADSCDVPYEGAFVTYAYNIVNTGSVDVELTSVNDSQLGQILNPSPRLVVAGESYSFIAGPTEVTSTTASTTEIVANMLGNSAITCEAVDSVIVNTSSAPEYSCKDGKPAKLVFTYVGGSCADSNHNQGSSKSSCTGDSSNVDPVLIKIADKNGNVVTQKTVNVGETVTFDNDGSKLDSETNVYIFKDGQKIQSLNIHTSCSVPLAVGDQHGGVVISGFTPEGDGKGSKGKGSKGKDKGSKGKGSKGKDKGSKGKGSKGKDKGSKGKGSKGKDKGSKGKGSKGKDKDSKGKGSKGKDKDSKGKGSKGKKGKKGSKSKK